MSKVTQGQRILRFIKETGSITHAQAVSELGILGFTARISDLRKKGWPIVDRERTKLNRWNEPVRFNEYRMEGW